MRLTEDQDVNAILNTFGKDGTSSSGYALKEALNLLQKDIKNNLKFKADQTISFANLMKDYSKFGTYDVGSDIGAKDFAKLFTYDYDNSIGADLNRYAYGTSNIPLATGEYADIVTTTTKDFSTFDGPSATLSLGEFITGYVAHIKIVNKDVTSNSHDGKLTLQFGVSTITDKDNIL
jgi:hypothetical protein